MDFFDNLLDDTHRALRDWCRRFAEREIAPHAVAWEEAETFPRALYGRAAEAGILGVNFSESVGGAGGGALHAIMVIEGLLYGGSTGVVVGLSSHNIGLPPIVQSGDAALIDRYARPTWRGDLISALAITEPDTGSDVAGIRTRAVCDGDDYVINGAKLYISSGVRADVLMVLARTSDDPHGGLSFFAVDRTM